MLKKITITGLGTLLSMSVFAADPIYDVELPLIWGSVITLSGGPAWTTPGNTQYL